MTCVNLSTVNTPINLDVISPSNLLIQQQRTDITLYINRADNLNIEANNVDVNILLDRDCMSAIVGGTAMPDFMFYIAGEDIESYRVVYQDDDEKIYITTLDLAEEDYLKVKGVIVNSTTINSRGQVQLTGELYNSNWNWEPPLPVYLGVDGELTQEIPLIKVFLEIGKALTETSILLDLEEPIIISD